MQGSMRQRGDSWQLRVFAGYDPVTGNKRWVSKTVRGGKREAQRALAAMVTEVDHGMAGTDASFSFLLERWFEVASPDWSPKTAVSHRSIINNHLTPRLGDIPLRKLRAADLDSFYAALRKLPGRRSATLSPSTIRRIHVVLHAALEQAVKWGWLAVNPARAATPPKVLPAVVIPPEAEDVARLLNDIAERQHDLYAYLSIAVTTGARRSQMCGLQWGDINLDTGSVLFCRAVVDGLDGLAVKGTKTNRPYRVNLDPDTMAVVREHHRRQSARA
ncbi:MAG: tyrosine-type recombinase/integrase family protein, partial [Acidimicrobiales bacterium]|nr:tyrosine-type recombinase/integrase family protein [Acidimicrobiales bacterium]